jgi:ribose 5-phosphate isomerase A
MADPAKIADQLKGTVGVVEHGLFIGMAKEAIIALPTGIETLQPS